MCIKKISWVGVLGFLTVLLASATAGAASPRSPSDERAPSLALNQEAFDGDLPQPPSSVTSPGNIPKGGQPSSFYLSASVSEGLASLSNAGAGSSGSQTTFMMLGQYVLPNWIFEAGGGWCISNLGGQASGTTTSSSDLSLQSYSLAATSGVAEISPQYRLTEHLAIGPLAEALFGTDVSFGSIGTTTQDMMFLGGAQALYEFRLGPSSLRIGARYLASLDLPGELLQSVQATLQFGLPIF